MVESGSLTTHGSSIPVLIGCFQSSSNPTASQLVSAWRLSRRGHHFGGEGLGVRWPHLVCLKRGVPQTIAALKITPLSVTAATKENSFSATLRMIRSFLMFLCDQLICSVMNWFAAAWRTVTKKNPFVLKRRLSRGRRGRPYRGRGGDRASLAARVIRSGLPWAVHLTCRYHQGEGWYGRPGYAESGPWAVTDWFRRTQRGERREVPCLLR